MDEEVFKFYNNNSGLNEINSISNDSFKEEKFIFNENCDNKIINENNYFNDLHKYILIENKETAITSKEPQPLFDLLKNKNLNENNVILNNQKNILQIGQNMNSTTSKSKKCFLGRKKKNSNEIGAHSKYCQDNIIKKIKSFLLYFLKIFINSLIYKIYNGDIGKGIFIKELKIINQIQIIDTKNDKEFIYKTLKDIFSDNISKKYTYYLPQHNKNLIEKLLNEEDYEKRVIFQKLFSLTFLDCLMYFRGDKKLQQLDGLKTIDEINKDFEDDLEYLELFKYYVIHFEENIKKKRKRNTKKVIN